MISSPSYAPGKRDHTREALSAAIRGDLPLVVYQWRAWHGFLIRRIAPGAHMIKAGPLDQVDQVTDRLPSSPGAFLIHIDCSLTRRFPVQREELIAGLQGLGWILCNEEVVDICKRNIQRRLAEAGCRSVSASQEGLASDLLIVKSNHNHGGGPERAIPEEYRDLIGIGQLPPQWLDEKSYRVLPRSEVLPEWWSDPSLSVERFIDNEDRVFFRASLAGEDFHLMRLLHPAQIKKSSQSRVIAVWTGSLGTPPTFIDPWADAVFAEVRVAADALSMDFGSMDVAVTDAGEPFIVDVNQTPALNPDVFFPRLVRHLSGGRERDWPIRGYFRSARRSIINRFPWLRSFRRLLSRH
jgi:hypothetical protein